MLSLTKSFSQDSYVQLVGGYDSLYTAIKKETMLTDTSCKAGKVFVQFDVNILGKTENVQIQKGICPYADSVAKKIVERLNYIPASRYGELIKTTKFIPIFFTREE